MPFWIYGRDAVTGEERDPLFAEAEVEEIARRQAAEEGLRVEEVERVGPAEGEPSHRSVPAPPAEPGSTRREPALLITTTPMVEGRSVLRHCGLVTGEAILGAGDSKDSSAALSVISGHVTSWDEERILRGRDAALAKLEQAAVNLGANAVVGLHLDTQALGDGLLVTVRGTAVVLE